MGRPSARPGAGGRALQRAGGADTRATFKGYLASFESLPEGSAEVPCFFGDAPDAGSAGYVARVAFAVPGGGSGGEEPPPPEPDPEPTPGQLLFSDSFSRTSSNSLGSDWAFNVDEAAVLLRAQGDARYALVLMPERRIQIRRYRDGRFTVLGEASSGKSDGWDPATLTLSVRGASPVELSASVDGQVRLVVTDSGPDALGGEGLAGIATPIAGVWFDDFTVRVVGSP